MNLRESFVPAVTATSPAQVLSAVPYLLGFHPRQSLVVLCLDAVSSWVRMTMRMDLPDPSWHRRLADEVAIRVAREGPGSIVLLCYDDGEPPAGRDVHGRTLPRQDLVDAIAERLADSPAGVLDAVLVNDGRWWSYLCADPACCPPDGAALPGPEDGLAGWLAAEAAVRGRRTLAAREELVAGVGGPEGPSLATAREAFARAAAQLMTEAGGPEVTLAATLAMVDSVGQRYLTRGHEIADDEVARICLGLAEPRTRDAVMNLPVAEHPGWPALLIELARRTPDDDAVAICTVLAWAAAERGDGALANVALDRALAADPGYLLARLLRCGLDAQLSPEGIRSLSSGREGWMPP